MSVKWIKLSTGMFDDEKITLIEQMPEADTILIIWIKLLAQAGKTNASGYIYLSENIPYTDEMLAAIFRRPISTVRLALKTFQEFGMIEINGDLINVSNWERHQNIEGLDKIRRQTQKRVARHREKKKKELLAPEESYSDNVSEGCNVTVTPGNATEEELEEEKNILTRQKYDEGSPYLKMAVYFYERVSKVAEDAGISHLLKKSNMQKWADDMRKLIELDKVDKHLAKQVMDWVTHDPFWRTNVLSAKKLREKFASLAIKMNAEKQPQQPKQVYDARDKEIAFQQFIQNGGDPNEFDWSD